MLGAIIGDIVGSRFEFDNILTKDFEFFHRDCCYTDDTAMTLAIGLALLKCENTENLGETATTCMREMANMYYNFGVDSNAPIGGYGCRFVRWLLSNNPMPYNSCGNGSAMRISAVPYMAKSLEECKTLSKAVTEVSHNHPEGIKGAESVAVAIFMLREGKSKEEAKNYIAEHYYPVLSNCDFTVDEIRKNYQHSELCQKSVPQAFQCFFESVSFEDAIRNAVSIGGDSDTIACISGALAEAFYGIPEDMKEATKQYLDEYQLELIDVFYKIYVNNKINITV